MFDRLKNGNRDIFAEFENLRAAERKESKEISVSFRKLNLKCYNLRHLIQNSISWNEIRSELRLPVADISKRLRFNMN